jgi:hypothetical protein
MTFRRFCFGALLSVACWIGAASAADVPARDWKAHPAIVEMAMPTDLYVLGDVHGDYDRLVQVLSAAKLIAPSPANPAAAQWTGGPAVLVSTGDFIDKYNYGVEVIALLRALQPQAEKAGGRVVINLGNHEAEFLAAGGDDKKAADFTDELTAQQISPQRVAAGTDAGGIGAWLRNLPAGTKVGDWFFCHAGNTHGQTLAQLEDAIQSQVSAQGFDCPVLVNSDSMLEARMSPRPWWDYDGSSVTLRDAPETKAEKKAAKAAAANEPVEASDPGQARLQNGIALLGCHHLVFGHQPGKLKFMDGTERAAGTMFTKFDGLVYTIDTGMSRGVAGGRGAVLHIHTKDATDDPTVTAVYMDGKEEAVER